MLSSVAAIVAGLKEAEGFVLSGGGALILRGDVRRQTRDLDFFGLTADAVDRLVPAADRARTMPGSPCIACKKSGFARLIVESGDDRPELDLGADARLFPAEPGCQEVEPTAERPAYAQRPRPKPGDVQQE